MIARLGTWIVSPLVLLVAAVDPGSVRTWIALGVGLAVTAGLLILTKAPVAQTKSVEADLSRLAFEKAMDPIFVCDESGVVRACNDALVKVLSATDKDAILGLNVGRFSPDAQASAADSEEEARRRGRQAIERGPTRFEAPRRTLDGKEFLVEVTLVPYEVGGLPRTISYWKNLEEVAKLRDQRQHLAKRFETDVIERVGGFTRSAADMRAMTRTMSEVSGAMERDLSSAAASVGQASANAQMVASAAEQLSASVGEINRRVAMAAEVSEEAADKARQADAMIHGLADSAAQIDAVAGLIKQIASQTNLLALNATIEAARAGDMGKGFAVVAGEVKTLANQTAKATEDIAGQILAVQDRTRQAVDAVNAIRSVIDQMRGISSEIATATEEQSAATREIASNVQQAADGINAVSQVIDSVVGATTVNKETCVKLAKYSDSLTESSDAVRSNVADFLRKI